MEMDGGTEDPDAKIIYMANLGVPLCFKSEAHSACGQLKTLFNKQASTLAKVKVKKRPSIRDSTAEWHLHPKFQSLFLDPSQHDPKPRDYYRRRATVLRMSQKEGGRRDDRCQT